MKKRYVAFFIIFSFIFSAFFLTFNEAQAKKLNSINDARTAAKKQVPSAQITEVELDTDKGTTVYEVSMIKKNKEYNLKFRASDGKLLEYEWEVPNTGHPRPTKTLNAKSKIRKKALSLVKKSKVTSLRLTSDDGFSVYKAVLKKGSRQYKLLYDANNGKLLEYEWKITASGTSSSSKKISMQKAQNIALKKVPGATVVKVELDKDDGISVYEVELKKDGYEYDIKIDAKSGKILEFDQDMDD